MNWEVRYLKFVLWEVKGRSQNNCCDWVKLIVFVSRCWVWSVDGIGLKTHLKFFISHWSVLGPSNVSHILLLPIFLAITITIKKGQETNRSTRPEHTFCLRVYLDYQKIIRVVTSFINYPYMSNFAYWSNDLILLGKYL